MRFHWRKEPISGHRAWRGRIAPKDDVQGRSAPTLANAWCGPMELLAALSTVDSLSDFDIEDLHAEEQTHFDDFGGPRNHDLVVVGTTAGEKAIVCIEAKAGETFGGTVDEYRGAAIRKREGGDSTNAPERLERLLSTYAPDLDPLSEEVGALRYQLLTALAGTVMAASELKAQHAVLMIHEFKTDARESADNSGDLARFATAVLGVELPSSDGPWCIELPTLGHGDARLYLAKASSDFRSPVETSG